MLSLIYFFPYHPLAILRRIKKSESNLIFLLFLFILKKQTQWGTQTLKKFLPNHFITIMLYNHFFYAYMNSFDFLRWYSSLESKSQIIQILNLQFHSRFLCFFYFLHAHSTVKAKKIIIKKNRQQKPFSFSTFFISFQCIRYIIFFHKIFSYIIFDLLKK
jgi:hypothetical protein